MDCGGRQEEGGSASSLRALCSLLSALAGMRECMRGAGEILKKERVKYQMQCSLF